MPWLEYRAETVAQECSERNVLLTNKPVLRQLARREQIQHGAHAGSGGHLDGGAVDAADLPRIDLVC